MKKYIKHVINRDTCAPSRELMFHVESTIDLFFERANIAFHSN